MRLAALIVVAALVAFCSCASPQRKIYGVRLRQIHECLEKSHANCLTPSDEKALQGVPILDLSKALGKPDYCEFNGQDVPLTGATCPSGAVWGWSSYLKGPEAARPALGGDVDYQCSVNADGHCVLKVYLGQ